MSNMWPTEFDMLAIEPQLLAKLPAALTANGLRSRVGIGKRPSVLQGHHGLCLQHAMWDIWL